MKVQPTSGPAGRRLAAALSGDATQPKSNSWRSRAKGALNHGLGDVATPESARMASRRPRWEAGQNSRDSAGPATPRLQPTVLVAHADEDLLASICAELRQHGYTVVAVESGEEALAKVRALQPALALLDLTLPEVSGLDVCKHLKSEPLTAEMQVILLSGTDDALDRVVGFELGADDYVSTPCNLRELALRVRAVLRRTAGWQNRLVSTVGPIVIDHTQCFVLVDGDRVHLTAIEFRMLALLAGRPGVVQSRDTLLSEVWGDETAIDPRSVDTYLRRLRLKLGRAAIHLKTVRGLGYRLTA